MKRNHIAGIGIAIALLTTTLVSCESYIAPAIRGTGPTVQADLIMDPFVGFVSAIAANIFITQGEDQLVTVKAQDNIIDNLCLEVVNGTWIIRYEVPVIHADPVTIYITVPRLEQVGLSGSGNITGTTPFTESNVLDLAISGSGIIELESVSRSLEILLSGSGSFKLKGGTEDCFIRISGSGSINAFDLATEEAEVIISGSGNSYLAVSDFLKVLISGSGSVYYKSNPVVDATISGSGRVVKDF
ncbi:MAG: head GIN domain-containing protein [Bacteroidales bacterium]